MSGMKEEGIFGKITSKINKVLRFNSKPKINPKLKIRSFKVKPNQSTSITSGATILSIGLLIGISIPAMNFENTLGFSQYEINTSRAYDGLAVLIIRFTIGIIIEWEKIAGTLVLGWFIGGIVASVIFNQEGKRGPYYSALIAISITMAISFILGIIVLTLNKGVFEFNLLFLPMIGTLVLSLLLAIISIPLIIIALIGYKIGGYFENV